MHEQMRPLLNAYLDGELHGKRLLEMKAHLVSCESCRNELNDLAACFRPVKGCTCTGIYAR